MYRTRIYDCRACYAAGRLLLCQTHSSRNLTFLVKALVYKIPYTTKKKLRKLYKLKELCDHLKFPAQ